MNEKEIIESQINSSLWYCQESDKLIKQYKECKTEHARNKMIPKIITVVGKMEFQKREIMKYIPKDYSL